MEKKKEERKKLNIFEDLPEGYEHTSVVVMGNLREQFNYDEIKKGDTPVYRKQGETIRTKDNDNEEVDDKEESPTRRFARRALRQKEREEERKRIQKERQDERERNRKFKRRVSIKRKKY